MAATDAKTRSALTVQNVCIDLPGETVQCWRSSDNIRVILRKHRDVIFELKLGQGKKYTVESTGSDFYDATEKKLVPGKGVGCVVFNDGDRLHLWTARGFKGELLLKSAGQLLLKLDPAKFDAQQYDDAPKTKPAPIIIAFDASPQSSDAQPGKTVQPATILPRGRPPTNAQPIAASVDENCALICVVEGNLKGIPANVLKVLRKAGERVRLIDLDPEDIITRTWLLGQIAGASAYVGDNWDWLRASLDDKTHAGFKLVKAKIHYVKGKARYFFSGYSKHNAVFGPGGFGPGHDRIMSIFGGTGKVSSVLNSTVKGVAATFKGNALVSFVFSTATALAEWKQDVSKDGYDLAASLLMNVVKSIVVAALVVAIVACLVLIIMFFIGTSISVVAVGGLTIGAGVITSYGIDVLDKKLGRMVVGASHRDGLSAVLAERMRQSVHYHWYYLKKNFLWDYEELL